MSEIARIVAKFDDTIDYLQKLVKENPNDADLGGEVRKLVRQLIKEQNTGNYE
jgi:hypothetical protein